MATRDDEKYNRYVFQGYKIEVKRIFQLVWNHVDWNEFWATLQSAAEKSHIFIYVTLSHIRPKVS